MDDCLSRRSLLCHALAGATFGIGRPAFAATHRRSTLPFSEERTGVSASGARVESLVRLLKETPRTRVIDAVAGEIRKGATYRDVLAALLVAGAHEVQPRPSVGFKFHTVLAVISYHLIGAGLSEQDRWLPLFWGIDYFKAAQASDASEGDWKQPAVDEAVIPPPDKAGQALVEAMQRWDEAAADTAAAAVARYLKPDAAFELFYPLGARDFRSIGHKAIFVMCAQRTLKLIGWQYAEPVLRSLTHALLMHENGNPADRADMADLPWRWNQKIEKKIRSDWKEGEPKPEATTELLSVLRSGSPEDAANAVFQRLNHGTSPSSIWDAVFCGAAELNLRSPNIVSLHAVTTTRAINYAFRTTTNDRTRRLLLLQNAAMLPLFRDGAARRGQLREAPIELLEARVSHGTDEASLKDILADLGGQRRIAAQKIYGYLDTGRSADLLVERIRKLVSVKGNGTHDFKFTSAALESSKYVSPAWRGLYLACGAMHFSSPDDRDNDVVQRTRSALFS
jgi:hypothetical protein